MSLPGAQFGGGNLAMNVLKPMSPKDRTPLIISGSKVDKSEILSKGPLGLAQPSLFPPMIQAPQFNPVAPVSLPRPMSPRAAVVNIESLTAETVQEIKAASPNLEVYSGTLSPSKIMPQTNFLPVEAITVSRPSSPVPRIVNLPEIKKKKKSSRSEPDSP